MTNSATKAKRIKRIAAIAGAWITLPILGLGLLLLTTIIGIVVVSPVVETIEGSRLGVITGAFGIILLFLLIMAVWGSRKVTYVRHLLIGLWIGIALFLVIFTVSLIGYVSTQIAAVTGSGSSCTTLKDQFSRVQSAVVPIATDTGTGTGVAIKDGSTIVTAYHVVEGAKEIKMNFLDDERSLTVIDTAPEFDLAILKTEKAMAGYMNLAGTYAVADQLYAIGYPGNAFDAGQASLSSGILSRVLTNDDLRLNVPEAPVGLEMVQTDMALNPGNSGGPIINQCGVIGIVSMKSNTQELAGVASEEGINYGVSAKTVAKRFNLPIIEQ